MKIGVDGLRIEFTNSDWKFVWEEKVQEQRTSRPIFVSPQLKLSWSWDVTILHMTVLSTVQQIPKYQYQGGVEYRYQ